jgi:hypothetical protein
MMIKWQYSFVSKPGCLLQKYARIYARVKEPLRASLKELAGV